MRTGETEETEETCGCQRQEDSSSKVSFTTLSSIAIQAGRTQIVASVLQSGSLIHLQLVQFQPGLCEIGSDRDENHILIQEQQQLLEKLQKHEPEVLVVIEKKHQEKLRMRRDGRRKQEEEEELTEAMKASLREGWSLLLQLLERRLDVLKQASDFFCRVMEFAIGIDRLENLQVKNEDKLNEVRVSYDFMRKDLLGKSLQVLTSSSILLQTLRQLQRTEALQRRGMVLQGDEDDVEESSQYSRGPVLRLEQLVEDLQDRRRRADQAFRLQLQQAEVVLNMREESKTKNQSLLNQNLQFGSTSDQTKDLGLKSGSRSDFQIKSSSEQNLVEQTEEPEDVKLESRLQESGQEPDVKPDSWFNPNSKSRLNHFRDLKSGSGLDKIKHMRGSRSEFRSGGTTETRSETTRTLQSESSSSESTKLKTESGSQSDSRSDLKPRSEELGPGSQQDNDLKLQSGTEKTNKQQLESKTKETRNPQFSFTTVLKTKFRLDELYICEPDVKPGSRCGEITENRTAYTENRSEQTRNLPFESSSAESSDQQPDLKTEPESQNSRDSQIGFRSEPKNQLKSELLISGPRSVLKTRSRSEEQQHTSGCDGKPRSTGSGPKGIRTFGLRCNSESIPETGSEKAPLKSASIQQRGSGSEKPESSSAEITDLQIGSKLDLKNQTRSQQGEDLNHLSGSEKTGKQSQESKMVETKFKSRSDKLLRFGSDAKPGSESEVTKTPEISGSGSDPASVKNRLGEQQQMEARQQQEEFRSGYQERLVKTRQDLNCVSELLDSCTSMDLGSELQTNRLLEQFRQAEPHFRQLDVEVENTVRSWENLSGVQARQGGAVMEEDLSELLKLQQAVKDKIQQGESILNQSSSFHLIAKQLELLLQSEPPSPLTDCTGVHGPKEEELSHLQEAQQQIQNLLRTTSTMKTDICTAVSQSNWAGFQVDQLEIRLGSLDSLCVSWLNKAAQCEEELRRGQLTHLLHEDITQLRESFKELKKRFSNTKFNYLKRNDRTRNLKAVWNQLQQMEVYLEKLQGLRKRVHGVTARLGSEAKNTGMARQLEDAINELQRQMGQLERNICEHQKTLDMTCKLQQAMEEYHFWCEEASATIARVGKFSLECRSTEAVSVLYRQFEKFVWPTVPQQEERISQITELAVRLHGVEEGQRYIEKTVSKHSEMVESIRELSEGLMELEAKLKLENLKQQQQKDEEEKVEEEGESEQGRETEEQEKIKEKSRMKQKDNRHTQEAADMHELKETGHTPELITENDRKEAAAANRKPPSEKSDDVNGPTANRELHSEKFTSSFTSTLTICSPVDAKRQVQAALNQSQTAASEPQAPPSQSVIGPSFPDNQEEFLREMEGVEQHIGSSFCGSNSLQETSPHVELHQAEVTTEDCFSNDEYDCASPDDISLPPLAETPESNMFHSDVEEGFCLSSHSVHISQVSHHCYAQSEPTRTDSVPQQKESSQMESCPAPTVRLQSRTRFRSESRSFNPSPSTVPVTTLFTSTPCTILKTKESTSDVSLDNPVHGYNNKDCFEVKNSPKQRCPSTTLTQDLSQSLHPQSFNGSDKSLHNHNIPKGETEVLNIHPSYIKTNSTLPEKRELLESHHCTSQTQQDITSAENSRIIPQQDSLAKSRTSLVSQQNIYIRSSFSGNYCTNSMVCSNSAQESTFNPSSDPVSLMFSVTDPILHKNITQPQDNDLLEPSTTNSQSSTSQDPTFPHTRSEPDQDVLLTLKDSTAISTATTVTQSIFNRSLHFGRSQTNKTSNQDPRDPPEDLIQNLSQPKTISNTSIYCSKQGLQTVFPLQDTQQCVHGSSMSPSSAQLAPPHLEPQTHPSPDQANLHGTSPYSTPHVLTPSQDPDICQPMAIREEIRLTPQIQGPPLPSARLPHPSSESIPLGKVSAPGLTLFTRPWSQATVMEGCPVMLEVEVMGNPEPRLTRFKLEEDQNQNQDQDLQLLTGSSSGADNKWLMLEALDVIMEDWNTWFGTLCVLLWLLYLVLL
ncbi:trichohyalin isoform X1 [Xiphophorus hellerii]|uniref:trichohyalin isoform X1 n=1 Tax=Xiphophorus hellerii TaxID=8084 RepID=UPI0013B3589B|nr:coiled-coil domain-containing protein 141 isoform X1 [Xiphophorus hellerii]